MVGGWGAVGCAVGDGSPSGATVCPGSDAGAGSVGIGAGVGRTNGVSSFCGCDDATLASSASMAAPASSGWLAAGVGSGSSALSVRSSCGAVIVSGVGSVKLSESGAGCGEVCIDLSWSLSSCSIILAISGCGSWLSGWITRSPPRLVGRGDGGANDVAGSGSVSAGVAGSGSEVEVCSGSDAGVDIAGSVGTTGSVAAAGSSTSSGVAVSALVSVSSGASLPVGAVICSVGVDESVGIGAAVGRANGAGLSVIDGVKLSEVA